MEQMHHGKSGGMFLQELGGSASFILQSLKGRCHGSQF